MGTGYELTCNNCGNCYQVTLGVGFAFPRIYENLIEAIEAGRFGEEWRELAAQTDQFGIDAEDHLYRCDECGYWECAPSLSIYAPKDIEKVLNTQYGEKTVRERGRVPYVTSEDLKADYKLIKERVHVCRRCGNDMHMISSRGLFRAVLKCPDCGSRLEWNKAKFLWD